MGVCFRHIECFSLGSSMDLPFGKKQDKEILEVIAKRLEENSEEDQLRILQSVNDSIQKSNAQLRMEVNDSLSRLTQTQNQNMVGFTDLIQR